MKNERSRCNKLEKGFYPLTVYYSGFFLTTESL